MTRAYTLVVALIVAACAAQNDTHKMKDPTMKHDTKQCGQYLCPSYPNAAEKYIFSGCEGTFESYVAIELAIAAGDDSTTALPAGMATRTLVALASSTGLVALVIGVVAGSRDKTQQRGYRPVPYFPN